MGVDVFHKRAGTPQSRHCFLKYPWNPSLFEWCATKHHACQPLRGEEDLRHAVTSETPKDKYTRAARDGADMSETII